MGVHGLWRLIEPSGKPVPLETLENKVLAVDISIWLHQAVKGFQDPKGGSLPNAHLLGIFHRICKLLYFRIKPVFVFDGGVPVLKKQTIAKRNQLKIKNTNDANRIQKQLINTLLKHSAVNKVIVENVKTSLQISNVANKKTSSSDMFELPPSQFEVEYSSESESETESSSYDTTESSSPSKSWDLHSIDEKSTQFKSLPADVRHEILTELKETRKQNSWGRIHELPTQSDDFSGYQMKRLLKRYSIQISLEEAEKEMGGASLSLGELESLLKDHGVVNSKDVGGRIASDENKRYFYIKSMKKALEDAKNKQEEEIENIDDDINKNDVAIDEDLEKAITLSLQDVPSTSKSNGNNFEEINEKEIEKRKTIADKEYEEDLEKAIKLSLQQTEDSFNNDIFINDSDSESEESDNEVSNKILASAKNYMTEYSGLTPSEIAKIISGDHTKKNDNNENISINKVEDKFDDFKKPQLSKLLVLKKQENKTESKEDNFNLSDEEIDEKVTKNDDVSIISNDSDSDSSDFLEVESETSTPPQPNENNKNSLEIMIQKDEKFDDSNDIFSDIFEDVPKLESKLEIGLEKETELNEEPKNNNTESNVKIVSNVLLNEVMDVAGVGNVKELDKEKLEKIELELSAEKDALIAKQSLKERLATNISEQMRVEVQELLRLFGVPYVIAPMEAEAQCAFLDEINLTDGTITDDSDIWLFGGKTVYKNFFNQSKRVLEYKSENILHYFKLSRYEMILLALLVGSDYTTGVQGVGPVTALEILAHFPFKKQDKIDLQNELVTGLREFKRWIKGEYNTKGRATLRKKLKNVNLSDQFPSIQVVGAYLEPRVETSDENFTWSKPDLVSLIDYAKEKFGWNQSKSEEILKPVFKSFEKTDVQSKITNYFQVKRRIDGKNIDEIVSKRVKTALNKIGKNESSSDEEKVVKENKPKRKQNKTLSKPSTSKQENPLPMTNENQDDDLKVLQQTKKVSRKRAKQIENELRYEMEQQELRKNENPQKKMVKKLHSKEVIPQKQKDKADMLKSRMKAIETFRKSKQGPGFVKKRSKKSNLVKEDAELSEDSD
nr:DNA repair protein complementing XP-G cells homolog isoform X1 [Onthophagus taurus]XP_022914077.1 DNA repair protein complementing XP-G cells homolog isoform X1 [Onthophagus taurus]